VALASYVVFEPQKAATPAAVAEAFAVLLLPFTVVGPFAGPLLDRWPRRQVLAWANFLRAALIVLLAFIVLSTSSTVPFYICALAALSANRFILAGLSAALPHTVTAKQLVVANAFSPTAGTVAAAAGAVVSFVVGRLPLRHGRSLRLRDPQGPARPGRFARPAATHSTRISTR
jgi:MFS family permease